MSKEKGFILVNPFTEKEMLRIFNDLMKTQVVPVQIKKMEKGRWQRISGQIGKRCKSLIDIEEPTDGLMFPLSMSRGMNIGFVSRPKQVEIEIIDFKKQKKIIFNRKLF